MTAVHTVPARPRDQGPPAILCPAMHATMYRPDPAHPERLLPVRASAPRPDLTVAAMHGAFRAFVLDPQYSCVGARSAVHSGSYRLGVYERLGDATAALGRDLASFTAGIAEIGGSFATFVALFRQPRELDELEFEAALWAQLQALHDADAAAWDPQVSADPGDPRFAFSFAGQASFVIGLHPGSGRVSRRFPWPALVFNPHVQFEHLRQTGKYGRMQAVIRERERALQGDVNPALGDFGVDSEARQYSGRAVEPGWRPPFCPHLRARP